MNFWTVFIPSAIVIALVVLVNLYQSMVPDSIKAFFSGGSSAPSTSSTTATNEDIAKDLVDFIHEGGDKDEQV